jgi:hypothetical protein
MPHKPETFRASKANRFYALIAGLTLVYFATLGLIIYAFSQTDINAVHRSIVGVPVPSGASHIEYDSPWRDDYTIISYSVKKVDLSEMEPDGFSGWTHLSELYVGQRFFSSTDMPHAWISSRKLGKGYSAIIVDLDHNKVYVVYTYT